MDNSTSTVSDTPLCILSYDNSSTLIFPTTLPLAAFRMCATFYMTAIVIFSIITDPSIKKYLYYLTHIGWLIGLLYFLSASVITLNALITKNVVTYRSQVMKYLQSLFEISFVLQIMIFIFYWAVVYPTDKPKHLWVSLSYHGIGLLLLATDYIFKGFYFTGDAFGYLVWIAVAYSLYYCILTINLDQPIYKGITLKTTSSILIFGTGIISLLLLYKIVFILSNFRRIRPEKKSFIGICLILIFESYLSNSLI